MTNSARESMVMEEQGCHGWMNTNGGTKIFVPTRHFGNNKLFMIWRKTKQLSHAYNSRGTLYFYHYFNFNYGWMVQSKFMDTEIKSRPHKVRISSNALNISQSGKGVLIPTIHDSFKSPTVLFSSRCLD